MVNSPSAWAFQRLTGLREVLNREGRERKDFLRVKRRRGKCSSLKPVPGKVLEYKVHGVAELRPPGKE
jgi:hypothetical protein